GTNMDVIDQTKKMLHSSFNKKDTGEADVTLDLAYSISRLSRYSHIPGRDHWDALVRVLQYLKHTIAHGLHYTKHPPALEGYCDANWISNHNKGKSTSGYVFTLGGVAVSWKSSKQTVNTGSTMEAEFSALDKAVEEAEWLRSFLEGIPLWPKLMTAVCIHYDSMASLTRAKNHIYKGKSRHIRRRHKTIKDLLRNGIISIDYLKSKENIDDLLIKGLCREQVILTSRGISGLWEFNNQRLQMGRVRLQPNAVITQINQAIGVAGVMSQQCKTLVDHYGKTIIEMLFTEVHPISDAFLSSLISSNSDDFSHFCDEINDEFSNHNKGTSTSGYVFTLGGADVSWKSSKQTVYTGSTMEAEFVALDKAAEEAEWLRSFLEGISLWLKPV
nr:ATP phosphoribosyltransferase 1, chloroplastic [Tanacetum cinerariifolium]